MAGTAAVNRYTETTRPVLYLQTTLLASPRRELQIMCLAVGGPPRIVFRSPRERSPTDGRPWLYCTDLEIKKR